MHFIVFLIIVCILLAIGNAFMRLIFGIGWFTCQLLKFIIPAVVILLLIAAIVNKT